MRDDPIACFSDQCRSCAPAPTQQETRTDAAHMNSAGVRSSAIICGQTAPARNRVRRPAILVPRNETPIPRPTEEHNRGSHAEKPKTRTTAQDRSPEDSTPQVGSAQHRGAQVGGAQHPGAQIGGAQIGGAQDPGAQVGSAQERGAQISCAQERGP
jgi:hypothetical protein